MPTYDSSAYYEGGSKDAIQQARMQEHPRHFLPDTTSKDERRWRSLADMFTKTIKSS